MAKRVLTCEQDYSSELIDALAAFDARVRAVHAAGAWAAATPCTGWTASDLVRHVTGNVRVFVATVPRQAAAGGQQPPEEDPDLVRGWEAARAAADRVLRTCEDPANVRVPLGPREMTITFVMEALLRDVVIHVWDLARATGGDELLPDHLVSAATSALARLPQHIRERGYYEDALEPPPDATEQVRLLALAGRRA